MQQVRTQLRRWLCKGLNTAPRYLLRILSYVFDGGKDGLATKGMRKGYDGGDESLDQIRRVAKLCGNAGVGYS